MMKLDYTPRKNGMSPPKTRPRPLGSVRMLSQIDTVPKFPPLSNQNGEKMAKIERISEGISGSKLAVPPPRSVNTSVDIPSVRSDSKVSERSSGLSQHQHRIGTPQHANQHSGRKVTSQTLKPVTTTCSHLPELQAKDDKISELLVCFNFFRNLFMWVLVIYRNLLTKILR